MKLKLERQNKDGEFEEFAIVKDEAEAKTKYKELNK